jgi:hypothetical protein
MSAHEVRTKYFVYLTPGKLGRSCLRSGRARSLRVLDRERVFLFDLFSSMVGDAGGVNNTGVSTRHGSASSDARRMFGGCLRDVISVLGAA